jgi:tRNA 2-thiouridine synthesizing protein E
MATRRVEVAGQAVLTGGEGYLVDPADWSKAFARAQARVEALTLTEARWEPIRRLRQRFAERGTQAEVRDTVRHFSRSWGPGLGGRSALHRRFPRGGPQKQGNRLAGLLHTKGEH